jgi:acyl carrier protein phosphodiesterase
MWDHFLSRHWAQLSPEMPLPEFVRYAHQQVSIILPDSPPRFVNLNNYLWSERWLERYREMDFIQNVLNGWRAAVRDWMRCAIPGMTWMNITMRWRRVLAVLPAHDGAGEKQTALTEFIDR